MVFYFSTPNICENRFNTRTTSYSLSSPFINNIFICEDVSLFILPGLIDINRKLLIPNVFHATIQTPQLFTNRFDIIETQKINREHSLEIISGDETIMACTPQRRILTPVFDLLWLSNRVVRSAATGVLNCNGRSASFGSKAYFFDLILWYFTKKNISRVLQEGQLSNMSSSCQLKISYRYREKTRFYFASQRETVCTVKGTASTFRPIGAMHAYASVLIPWSIISQILN